MTAEDGTSILNQDRSSASLPAILIEKARRRHRLTFDSTAVRNARSFLFIRPEGMGDIILTLPSLAYIRRENPQARLAMAVRPIFEEFVEKMQVVDEVIPLDYPKRSALSSDQVFRFLKQVARLRGRFDIAFDFRGDIRNVLIGAWSAQIVVGPRSAGTSFLLSGKYSDLIAVPMAERNLRIVSLGQSPAPALADYATAVRYRIDNEAKQRALHLLPWKNAYVLIHPGASRADKQWSFIKWRALITRFLESGEQVIITGAGRDDGQLVSKILDNLDIPTSLVNLVNRTNCAELTAIVEKARIVISPDTGVAHIAFAYQVPSVTLFGSDNEILWGHRTSINIPLRASVSFHGEHAKTDPMNALTVDQVFSAASELLRRSSRDARPIS